MHITEQFNLNIRQKLFKDDLRISVITNGPDHASNLMAQSFSKQKRKKKVKII